MTWMIKNIEIRNFKFFKDVFSLDLNRKHLLLYGENGSGKSSIYWSLYTLFQSCYKSPTGDDAMKYFMPQNDQNLRNKFSDDADESSIKIVFDKGDNVNQKSYEDSNVRCNTSLAGDNFMRLTTGSSDFLNYKSLSALFDFKNSQMPDIFPILERESFSTLFGNPALGLHEMGQDVPLEPKSAEYWWRYLRENIVSIERCQNHKLVKKSSQSYKDYIELLTKFNGLLSQYVEEVIRITNDKLGNDFHVDVQLGFIYEEATIVKQKVGPEVNIDVRLCPPKVILKGFMIHNQLNNGRVPIEHPRSFFNEAKLTCIALAFRLGMIDSKHLAGDDAASVLVLDDLLISLDMSMRLKVIDTILKYSADYQMLIFTHDLSFYELIKEKIDSAESKDDWNLKKLYNYDDINVIPKPILLPNEDLLDKAKAFYHTCNFAACANTLRRICEIELKRLLTYNETHEFDTENEDKPREVVLKGMIDVWYRLCKDINAVGFTSNIQVFRKILMNPMSHGDVTTPIYREEVRLLLQDVETLCNIKKDAIVDKDHCSVDCKYKLSLTNGGREHWVTFQFLDTWSKYTIGDKSFVDNPKILMHQADFSKGICGNQDKDTTKLKNIYKSICKELFGRNETVYPLLCTDSIIVLP